MLAGEMHKKLVVKSTKIKTIQLSHGINRLAQNLEKPARPPSGLE